MILSIIEKTVVLQKSPYQYFLFFVGLALMVHISGTLHIYLTIAGNSYGYFVQKNIDQANEAAKLGYVKYEVNDYAEHFGLPWSSKPGVRRIIRSGPDDYDDVGYVVLLQLIALSGKEITIYFLEKMHNIAFVIVLLILSFIIAKIYNNLLAGWIFMGLALLFKAQVPSLVYGFPENRSLVLIAPYIVFIIFFGLNWLQTRLTWRGWLLILVFGMLIGLISSMRSSEGSAAIMAVLFFIFFLRIGRQQKAMAIGLIFFGYFLVTVITPSVLALHRDIKTGEFNGDIRPYLTTTGSHPVWHSIVIGMGKYPNSLGMRYDDVTCYDIVRKKYPEAMHPVYNIHGESYYQALQKIYYEYVTSYPMEYLTNVARAYAELLYFIPYATSAGKLSWQYGYLPIKPEVVPNERDLAYVPASLINLKKEYLKLSLIEWTVFLFAIVVIVICIGFSLFGKYGKYTRNIFLAIGFYMFLLASLRAIIPAHGISLLTCFWTFAVICLLHLFFNPTKNKRYSDR